MIRAAIIFAFIATPAAAQTACGQHDAILSHLATKYGETVASTAIMARGGLFEITANPTTGTWTALGTIGTVTCILSSGDRFRAIPLGVDA
jgi:hypothetical protein